MVRDPFGLHVVLVDAAPLAGTPSPVTAWPCPGCGTGRDLDRAWSVTIRNRTGPALQREALLCEDCVDELQGRDRRQAHIDRGASPPRRVALIARVPTATS